MSVTERSERLTTGSVLSLKFHECLPTGRLKPFHQHPNSVCNASDVRPLNFEVQKVQNHRRDMVAGVSHCNGTPKVHISGSRRFNSTKRHPKKEKQRVKMGGRGKKSAKFWAHSEAHPVSGLGPHPSGPHPRSPPTTHPPMPLPHQPRMPKIDSGPKVRPWPKQVVAQVARRCVVS